MQKPKLMFVFISLILSVSIAVAQDACPTIVADALTATDSVCSGIGRNEACYGNIQITAELEDTSLVFEQQGDIVELTEIKRLTLSPYVEKSTAWGVALMNVQANIPDTLPGQGVMFLLFGDVDITNAGDSMEAFYFSSGVGTAGCNEASNGIIINTPEGVGTVSLIANDVTIELGSTAVLTAMPDDVMTIALTEGHSIVTADGVSQEFEGGYQVTIPLDEDLKAIGAPSEPELIPEKLTETLPDIVMFLPELESISGTTTDATGAGAGGNILPIAGTWSFTIDSVTASAGCPPGFGDMISSQAIPVSSVEFDGTEFSLQALMEEEVAAEMPPNTTFSNPSPNVYTMEFSVEGSSFTWTYTLVSETLMTGAYVMDMNEEGFTCALSINYTVTSQD